MADIQDRTRLKLLPEVFEIPIESLGDFIDSHAIRVALATCGPNWKPTSEWLDGAVKVAHAIIRLSTQRSQSQLQDTLKEITAQRDAAIIEINRLRFEYERPA